MLVFPWLRCSFGAFLLHCVVVEVVVITADVVVVVVEVVVEVMIVTSLPSPRPSSLGSNETGLAAFFDVVSTSGSVSFT